MKKARLFLDPLESENELLRQVGDFNFRKDDGLGRVFVEPVGKSGPEAQTSTSQGGDHRGKCFFGKAASCRP